MKEKHKEIISLSLFTFIGVNILLTWLQGGGRYSYNEDINWQFNLIISLPITIFVTVMLFIEARKR